MLDTLLERARDVNSYTRARVLQTWAFLAESRAIPLGTYLAVSELAVGRLEDKASGVRKAACQLLATLLQWQPFGSVLSRERFAATLAEYQAKLPAEVPSEQEQLFDVAEEQQKEEEDAAVATQPEEGPETEEDVAGAATQADTQAEEPEAAETVEMAGNVESLRVLVASLTVAHDFAKLAADSLKPIGNVRNPNTPTHHPSKRSSLTWQQARPPDGAVRVWQRPGREGIGQTRVGWGTDGVGMCSHM